MTLDIADSYVTIAEAEAYFEDDPRAEDFLDEDITWYLIRATKRIDALPLKGTTYYDLVAGTPDDGQQNKQFPRYIDGVGYGRGEDTDEATVPQEVEDACCEEALAIYLHLQDPMAQAVEKMQARGATAASIGGEGSETWQKGARQIRHGLKSEDAYELLKGYIAGAVECSL
jgi:hypothetical protein